MNKKLSFIHILSAVLILISTVPRADATSHTKPITIRFASEIYPPFTALHSNEELQGFDIDIAKALCEKINAECTFSNDKFSNMIPSLKAHKYDAWISAITISEEHQKEVSFSKPYFSTKAVLIATNDTVFNAAPVEIKGRTIGIGEHTCYIQYLKNTYGDTIKVKTFHTKNESLLALEKGEVDAVIGDDLALKHWRLSQKDPKKYRLIGLPAKYSQLVWHKYGIAVAKDNDELIEDLNHAIYHIESDGTYDTLVKKYFYR